MVDMWSLGCILGEMLKNSDTYREAGKDKDKDRRFMFMGHSCFPLSPCEDYLKLKDKS